MDKIKPASYLKRYSITIVVILLAMILSHLLKPPGLYDKILIYCENRTEVNFAAITDFQWDIAYVDREYYGEGKKIKEQYKITGEFRYLATDFSSRIAFCKDDKLIYDLVLNHHFFEMDSAVEIFYPEAIFAVEWISKEKYDAKKLYLAISNK